MSKRSPISLDVKSRIVKRCIQNESNPNYEAKQLGVAKITVTEWVRKYKADGPEGLKESHSWKEYSEELKLAAIRDVLSGNHSLRETKRIEIAQYTIANNLDYQKSMKKYDVSYQQVYAWVRKYKSGNEEALRDNRGRNKPAEELDDHERLKLRIKELEARNEYLEMENAFAKKVGRDPAEKYTLTTQELELLSLAKEVKLHYEKRNGVLGYRQMRLQLNRKLHKSYNKKRYYRIMRALELKAVIRRKRPNYVKASEIHVAENVMSRKFQAEAPNMKWCTDVTEMKYGNGRKAYLSAILDVYDGSIVSWVMSHSNNNMLVMDTVKKAFRSNPKVKPLLHSDRGFQYTSHEYNRLQAKYKFTKSMSRVSRCLDNQPIERFWGTLKSESYYLKKYATFDELFKEVKNYIRYYNNYRYTERLNGLSPNEYRQAA